MVGPLRILDWVWLAIGLTWAALVAVEMLRRQRAGAVLLDIGYNPRREMQLGAGVLMLLGGCYMALSSSRYRIQGLAWVAWGMAQLVTATHRLQLRQARNGAARSGPRNPSRGRWPCKGQTARRDRRAGRPAGR